MKGRQVFSMRRRPDASLRGYDFALIFQALSKTSSLGSVGQGRNLKTLLMDQ
jgi:hypothetical protein